MGGKVTKILFAKFLLDNENLSRNQVYMLENLFLGSPCSRVGCVIEFLEAKYPSVPSPSSYPTATKVATQKEVPLDRI